MTILPRVRLLATGGTIASVREGTGHRARAGGADLLAQTTTPEDCTVEVTDLATAGSFAWQWPDLLALLRSLAVALTDDCAGVVVTHGTDTMEEVAFLAALTHADPRPVVFTGAQRPYDDPAPDGPANLADALRVAASPAATNRGVLVAFDGEVYGARGVTKLDTSSAHAFGAPGRGPQLRVSAHTVLPLAPAALPMPLAVDPADDEPPRVDVVPLYVGTDAALLRASRAAGAAGIVLAAFGVGNANPAIVEAVRECADAGVPVLVCSRVPAGPVYPFYRGGGGADLIDAGAVFGTDLSPWQGRMLLAACIMAERSGPVSPLRRWLDYSLPHGTEDYE